ncbi:MAG: hypothetical protein JNL62_08260 [Bryobacterales bacterium]|nr:hypothetical protein [Bryobacterales bacterium]
MRKLKSSLIRLFDMHCVQYPGIDVAREDNVHSNPEPDAAGAAPID